MTLRKTFIFCVLLWTGCLDKPKNTESVLVIRNTEAIKDTTKAPLPPPPPPSPYSYYGCFNFIFDKDGTLYFYQHFYDKDKAPVPIIDFDSDAPIFIALNPDQIIVIPNKEIKSFFESNILHVDRAYKSVRVIGMTDTIKSTALTSLMNELTDTANHIYYSIRPATLEEKTVLNYKKTQKFYNPDKINWDSSNIWFNQKQRK